MTDGNGNAVFSMPVAPAYGGGGFGGGMFGQDGWWIILLLLVCGGWGNGFGGGFGGGGGMFPWMMGGMANTNNDVQRGFDQNAVMTGLNGVQNAVTSGFGDVQTALCGGFGGVNASIANGFAQAEIAANARQIADMQNSFGIQSALQNCCCENRASIADLKYTVATEACADRNAISSALRDVLSATQAQTQTILNKMCQQELDTLKSQNLALQNQLNMANLAASQTAQTAQITDGVYQRLATCPVGTVPVYGEQAIFRCNNNNGCGCGGGI